MDNNKKKSIWDILVPQDSTDTDMQVRPPKERKKIVYTPDPDVIPLANPNPIRGNTRSQDSPTGSAESSKPSASSGTEKTEAAPRPLNTTSSPREGANTTEHKESNSAGKKSSTASTNGEASSGASEKKTNPWPVVGAIILLILIMTAAYFINESIKDKRKKRIEKNDDDFIDSFFDTKTGDIVRYGSIALGLFIVALALLYSTKLLTQAIKGVQETVKD